MKAVTIKKLKEELAQCSNTELIELILRLSKFKKENKELLTYTLLDSFNEEAYINKIKLEIDEQFEQINTKNNYFIKKSIRKILRKLKAQNRYSTNKETAIELLLYSCKKMKNMEPNILDQPVLKNIYKREIESIKKNISYLHEDLQYDFKVEIEILELA